MYYTCLTVNQNQSRVFFGNHCLSIIESGILVIPIKCLLFLRCELKDAENKCQKVYTVHLLQGFHLTWEYRGGGTLESFNRPYAYPQDFLLKGYHVIFSQNNPSFIWKWWNFKWSFVNVVVPHEKWSFNFWS